MNWVATRREVVFQKPPCRLLPLPWSLSVVKITDFWPHIICICICICIYYWFLAEGERNLCGHDCVCMCVCLCVCVCFAQALRTSRLINKWSDVLKGKFYMSLNVFLLKKLGLVHINKGTHNGWTMESLKVGWSQLTCVCVMVCVCVCVCDALLVNTITAKVQLGQTLNLVCRSTLVSTRTILKLVQVKGHLTATEVKVRKLCKHYNSKSTTWANFIVDM